MKSINCVSAYEVKFRCVWLMQSTTALLFKCKLHTNVMQRESISKNNSRPCKNKEWHLMKKIFDAWIVWSIIPLCVFLKFNFCLYCGSLNHWTLLCLDSHGETNSDRYNCDALHPLAFSEHQKKKIADRRSTEAKKSSDDRSLLLGAYDGLNDVKRDYA